MKRLENYLAVVIVLALVVIGSHKYSRLDAQMNVPVSAVQNGYQLFTASGTFTPPVGVNHVTVRMVGGGGGGNAGAPNGGGGAAFAWMTDLPVTPLVGITVTVGAGGASTLNGTASSFGTLASANGGIGSASGGTGGLIAGQAAGFGITVGMNTYASGTDASGATGGSVTTSTFPGLLTTKGAGGTGGSALTAPGTNGYVEVFW